MPTLRASPARIKATRLLAALTAWAVLLAVPAQAGEAIAPAFDLHADSALAHRQGKPLLLFFSLHGCQYCEVVRRNYLAPLLRDASPPVLREADITSEQPITGIDGRPTSPKELAAHYHVRVAPTVLLLDGRGELLAPPLVGGDTSGMYGAYLDSALEEAARRLR
jgi:thioredoxin-related protein